MKYDQLERVKNIDQGGKSKNKKTSPYGGFESSSDFPNVGSLPQMLFSQKEQLVRLD